MRNGVTEGTLAARLVAAKNALSRLNLAAHLVPSVDWFLYALFRKEAVLSSQIEVTQATLVDLLDFESRADLPNPDVNEVCNYVDELKYAHEQLAADRGLPLSMRMLNEIHRLQMRGARGKGKAPGEIRRSQNWIGGSKAFEMLEKYIHGKDALAPILRVGLVHVQFETIHPYLDGNGRISRLLISLLFEHWKLLTHPMLYLSLFFKRHQAEYYRRLSAVWTDGNWYREQVLKESGTSVAALRLFEALPVQLIVTVATVMRTLDTTKPTAGRAIEALRAAGVLIERTGRRRDRSFVYQKYVDRLSDGTDLN